MTPERVVFIIISGGVQHNGRRTGGASDRRPAIATDGYTGNAASACEQEKTVVCVLRVLDKGFQLFA